MKVIGIICEYNPFHAGHKKQFDILRRQFGEDCRIVCLMSGNYVQRGMPAIVDKSIRDKVLNAMYSRMGMAKQAKGIAFSLPVSDVAGLVQIPQETKSE